MTTGDDEPLAYASPAPAVTRVGSVWRITQWLDARRGAFFVSRLILATGIKVRQYGASSPDEAAVLHRLGTTLRQSLSPEEMEQIQAVCPEL